MLTGAQVMSGGPELGNVALDKEWVKLVKSWCRRQRRSLNPE